MLLLFSFDIHMCTKILLQHWCYFFIFLLFHSFFPYKVSFTREFKRCKHSYGWDQAAAWVGWTRLTTIWINAIHWVSFANVNIQIDILRLNQFFVAFCTQMPKLSLVFIIQGEIQRFTFGILKKNLLGVMRDINKFWGC